MKHVFFDFDFKLIGVMIKTILRRPLSEDFREEASIGFVVVAAVVLGIAAYFVYQQARALGHI